ncbi:MAG TPA: putative sulfate exporter family transporter [Candidatus Eisenbacteria bacterium]|nr:putative sulfate exporter family transporter [Candidatus Eisenbacteria bacterium]
MGSARIAVFVLIFIACFTGIVSPPVALTLGILFGLLFTNPLPKESRVGARILLQISVVALGFGMDLHEVLKAGRHGFVYTALGIGFSFFVGLTLARFLRVGGNSGYLITTGTAICGGSAIAAVGPILHADAEEMAVSLGTVFVLNSVALLIFPPLGHLLKLSQTQFGLWAALAIHDTSSVVGAASKYGAQSLIIGTTVKLARALWIVPLALLTATVRHSKSKIQFPWFILFFCLAAVLNTYLPPFSPYFHWVFNAGRLGLTATLFLIGAGISRETLRQVGWRPMALGIVLWLIVGSFSLYGILRNWIAL